MWKFKSLLIIRGIAPLVAFCLYYHTLNAGFVYDDR